MIVKINLFFNFKIIAMRDRRPLLGGLWGGAAYWYIYYVFASLLPFF